MLFGRSARYFRISKSRCGEIDLGSAACRFQPFEINRDAAKVQQSNVGTGAAQHRVHAGEQFFQVERLRDVIVGAEFQSAELVDFLSLRGEKDDRRPQRLAPALDELEAALARQVHVEQHEVRCKRLGGAGGRVPVRDALHLESFERQVVVEDSRQHRIVLDDEHALFHGLTTVL